MWRIHDRISFVSSLLRNEGFFPVVIGFRVGSDEYTGWYKIKAHKHNATIFIAEYISGGAIEKYSYTLLLDSRVILRYDNAPHFPEIHTHPHHKHYKDEVSPLETPQIEAFIKEVSEILKINR